MPSNDLAPAKIVGKLYAATYRHMAVHCELSESIRLDFY